VRIATPRGEVIHASTLNLSPAGLQIGGDRETAAAISTAAPGALPGVPVEVGVSLEFPAAGAAVNEDGSADGGTVDGRCRVVFLRRISERDFRIGLQFVDLPEDAAAALRRGIERLLPPP